MKLTRMALLVGLSCSLSGCGSTDDDSIHAMQLTQQRIEAYRAHCDRDDERSCRYNLLALEEARQTKVGQPLNLVSALNEAGGALLALKKVEPARPIFAEAGSLSQNTSDRELRVEHARSLAGLAAATTDNAQAEKLLLQSVDEYKQLGLLTPGKIGPGSYKALDSACALADIYYDEKKSAEALAAYQLALDLAKDLVGASEIEARIESRCVELGQAPVEKPDEHWQEKWKALIEQGHKFGSEGKHADGVQCFRQALALAQHYKSPSEEAFALGGLGFAYLRLHRLDEAEDACKRCLNIWISIKPDHSFVGINSGLLGVVYLAQKNYKAAEPCLRKQVEILKTCVEPNDPQYITALKQLAGCLRHLNRVPEAQGLEAEADRLSKH